MLLLLLLLLFVCLFVCCFFFSFLTSVFFSFLLPSLPLSTRTKLTSPSSSSSFCFRRRLNAPFFSFAPLAPSHTLPPCPRPTLFNQQTQVSRFMIRDTMQQHVYEKIVALTVKTRDIITFQEEIACHVYRLSDKKLVGVLT